MEQDYNHKRTLNMRFYILNSPTGEKAVEKQRLAALLKPWPWLPKGGKPLHLTQVQLPCLTTFTPAALTDCERPSSAQRVPAAKLIKDVHTALRHHRLIPFSSLCSLPGVSQVSPIVYNKSFRNETA
ncbi:Hypothetical predicted protein [Scomber scombrus]|uniref:Uncharacterized protein n=1 Tax=Scomber scombrus TaxID=13677 RepID=A0AAV1P3G4_SCOSC